jgi:N-acetylglucosamine kinase
VAETFVVGIDGGGTHARALLATPAGQVVAEGAGGPANFQAVGEEATRASVEQALDAALAAAPGQPVGRESIGAFAAGLAGLHVRADYDRFTALARAVLPASRVRIYNDGEVALAAATGGAAGIVVVAGTGSIAFGADRHGRHMRCGGWGYLLGDEGSAYAIVIAAFRAASFAADGRAPASTLVPAFCQALGVPTFDDMLRPVYGPPAMTRHQIAALAPLVARCAAEGDAAARAVLATAGEDLATMPSTLARRLELGASAFPVACSGGVWKAGEFVREPFRRRLLAEWPGALVGDPLLTPAAGAALLAIELLAGGHPGPAVLDNLRRTHAYRS